MRDDAEEPVAEYSSATGMAVFTWELPENGSGYYTEQQIGKRIQQSSSFDLEHGHCGTVYDCYSVNYSDTSTMLSMSKEEFDTSDFDHLVLQISDIVLTTPFSVTSEHQIDYAYVLPLAVFASPAGIH